MRWPKYNLQVKLLMELCTAASFHHPYKKDPAVNTVSSCIAPLWTETALPASRQYPGTRNCSITTRSTGICLTKCSIQVPDKLPNRYLCKAKFESLRYTKHPSLLTYRWRKDWNRKVITSRHASSTILPVKKLLSLSLCQAAGKLLTEYRLTQQGQCST